MAYRLPVFGESEHTHAVSQISPAFNTGRQALKLTLNFMFDFQKLVVYTKAKDFANEVIVFLNQNHFDKSINDQLKRASLSIMLNIAEGSSRFSNKDRRNFLIIARGSAFECVAIFDFLHDNHLIEESFFKKNYDNLEEISKMLFGLISKLEK